MVNFLAPPGNLMKPVAGSKEAVLPSGEMRTMAAFSSGDLVCTRSTSTSSPAGVTTALPSSHAPMSPPFQARSLGRKLLHVQFVALSRSASTGTDNMPAR